MNKKYLSVVLFGALMLGTAGTFTGCIDNDEPAGIEELRGAKAELLKAKAAVEQANAAYRQAETAWMQAKVQEQELLNKGIELGNQKLELELKVQEAKTEAEIAYWQSQLEQTKAELEINKVKWEALLLQSKQNLAYVQQAYDNAMAAIEASKLVLSKEELTILEAAQGRVEALAGKLETAHKNLNDTAEALNKLLTADSSNPNLVTEAELLNKIEEKQIALDSKNLEVSKIEELIAKNIDTFEGWEAEVKDLEAKIAAQDTLLAQIRIERTKIQESQEAKDAYKAWQDAANARYKAEQEQTDAYAGKKVNNVSYTFKLDKFSYNVASNLALTEVLDATNTGDVKTDYYKNGVFAYGDESYTQNDYINNKGTATESALKEMLALVNAVPGRAAEDLAWVNLDLSNEKKNLTAAENDYDKAFEAWEKAVKDYKDGKTYTEDQFNIAVSQMKGILQDIKDGDYEGSDDVKVAAQKAAYNEYITFRQTMTDNKQNNQPATLPATITDYKTLKAALDAGSVDSYVPAAYNPVDPETALMTASKAAFGEKMYMFDGKPRLTEPSASEIAEAKKDLDFQVMDVDDYSAKYGAMGKVWFYEDKVNYYTQIIEQAEAIQNLKAALTAQQDAVNKQIAANTASLVPFAEAVEKAKEAEVAAMNAHDALYADINAEEAKVTATRTSYVNIKAAIEKEIADIVDYDNVTITDKTVEGIKQALAEALNGAKEDVVEAEQDLAAAQKELELFKAGEYTLQYAIEKAQAELERAQARFDEAQAIYKIALEDLNALIAKFTAASEQPAA